MNKNKTKTRDKENEKVSTYHYPMTVKKTTARKMALNKDDIKDE